MKWKVFEHSILENLRSSLSVIRIEPLLNECFFSAPYVDQLGLGVILPDSEDEEPMKFAGNITDFALSVFLCFGFSGEQL